MSDPAGPTGEAQDDVIGQAMGHPESAALPISRS
jgi:hypothetical protein